MMTHCLACKTKIEPHEFDIGDAFKEVSPLSFRKGNYHRLCFGDLIEEAKQIESKHLEYESRYDEYLSKYT